LQRNDAAATSGKGWFDMLKPVMTKELAVDLKILQVCTHLRAFLALFSLHAPRPNAPQPRSASQSQTTSRAPQNRAALNPAAFYKKSAQRLPEYFQVGTVIQGATEFYSSRLCKQQRGRTFAEELLHDADVKFTLKKRFNKLQVGGAKVPRRSAACFPRLSVHCMPRGAGFDAFFFTG
jgi:hypothetical protein